MAQDPKALYGSRLRRRYYMRCFLTLIAINASIASCVAFGGHPFPGRGCDGASRSCVRQFSDALFGNDFREQTRTAKSSVKFLYYQKSTISTCARTYSTNLPATGEVADDESIPNVDNNDETTSTQTNNPDSLLESALASHAKQSSPLLGTKSIGIDYGGVRTGLAATIGYDFRPLRIVSDLNNTDLCAEVVATARSENAQRVVVGLPLHKNGTESERSNITRCFAEELSAAVLSNFGPDFGGVHMWDERYTSKEAKARIMSTARGRGSVLSADDLDGTIDADAACLILEHYYQNSGEGAEFVVVPDGYVRNKCLESWELVKKTQSQANDETIRKREEALNARQLMMNRIKEMEAAASDDDDGNGKRKKTKKKKRKKK